MPSLCSHKAARSVKTNYRLKPMIKTTLSLLSSALIVVRFTQRVWIRKSSAYLCASAQKPTAPAGLTVFLLEIGVSKPGFPQCMEAAHVHKTWSITLAPSPLQQSSNHALTSFRGIFDKKQKERRGFIEISLMFF